MRPIGGGAARARWRARSRLLAALSAALLAQPLDGQVRPDPSIFAGASTALRERLRADPFDYFRFVNRPWTARVCRAFADVKDLPNVRLHGDAHIEQYALTKDAWGLDDFDDSARGPAYVDIVRFLGSIDLATRRRGWTRDLAPLVTRFFEGYRRGLAEPGHRPPQPEIVRELRPLVPGARPGFLAWGESLMQPMDDATSRNVTAGMEEFGRFIFGERPDLPPRYFVVKRAGWLRIGVGSAVTRKVLIRVEGRTAGADDDQLLEAKEVAKLEGLGCLENPAAPPAMRVIDGARQLGRLRHDILAVGPSMLIPGAADRAGHGMDWWVRSWEPSYREVRVADLRSVDDLASIAYDSGVQLGAGEPSGGSARRQTQAALPRLEGRLRRETAAIVEEMLAGWREIGGR